MFFLFADFRLQNMLRPNLVCQFLQFCGYTFGFKVKFLMKRLVKQGMKRYTFYFLARGLIPVENQYTARTLVNSNQVILDPIVRNRSLRGLMLLPYVSFHWIKKTRIALTVLWSVGALAGGETP